MDYWCPGPALNHHPSGLEAPKEQKYSSLSNKHNTSTCPSANIKQHHTQVNKQQKATCTKSYLPTFDVFRAGSDVHGHSHDNLQPGLDCTCPPQWHACVSSQLRLLEAVQLLLSIRQALLCEAIRVWIGQEKLRCGIQENFRVSWIWKSNQITHLETIRREQNKKYCVYLKVEPYWATFGIVHYSFFCISRRNLHTKINSFKWEQKKNCYITTRWRQIILPETASIFEWTVLCFFCFFFK